MPTAWLRFASWATKIAPVQTVKGVIHASTIDQLGEGDVELSVGGVGAGEGYDRPGSVLGAVLITVSRGGRYAEMSLRPQEALYVARWIQEAIEALTEHDIADES